MVGKSDAREDRERFIPELHSSPRSDFARDRGRILHSSALRRLSLKTQVLSPSAGLDFARNRLTHSLEVAQIGRELAMRLGLDADVVETACLAHDLGHPPFGHNGEKALSEWAREFGGFEGNAQSFRLLVRLEPKVIDSSGRSRGLNLTRKSLLASLKYPWLAEEAELDKSGRAKFGVYQDDIESFDWARKSLPKRLRTIEAEVMDFSDDVAYSVHDFEDAIVNGFFQPASFEGSSNLESYVREMMSWVDSPTEDQLLAAWHSLSNLSDWVGDFEASLAKLAALKNLTSTLIGRFVSSVSVEKVEGFPHLVVPSETLDEIRLLKGIVAVHVMSQASRQEIYDYQRHVITNIASNLAAEPKLMEKIFYSLHREAADDEARGRVIVDQVACLTDQSAMELFGKLNV